MNRQFFIIPCELPSLNQIIDESKSHWTRYHKLKKEYSTLVTILAKIRLRPVHGRVSLSFCWYCRNRRKDPDNISSAGRKIILDGLVSAGILEDDGWKQVSSFTDNFEVDKNSPRVEVTLYEHSTSNESNGL